MPINTKGIAEQLDNLTSDGITFHISEIKGIKIFVEVDTEDLETAKSVLKTFLKDLVGGGVFFNVEVK